MSLLRRRSPSVDDGDDDDGAGYAPPPRPSRPAREATAARPLTERQQKAETRSKRMDLVRQARKATSAMQPPEPVRALYVSAYLVAIGVFSFLSTDVGQQDVKQHGKTVVKTVTLPPHPAQAVILAFLALMSAGSVYWKRRYLTGILFMLTAAIGVGTPLPKGLQDLTWVNFLVPAAFVLWMLIFRMNKEQKAWLADHGGQTQRAAPASRNVKSRGGGARSRGASATTTRGRPAAPVSGRYTPPRPKSRAAQRKP